MTTQTKPGRQTLRILFTTLILASLCMGLPARAAEAGEVQSTLQGETQAPSGEASATDTGSYAQREAQAPAALADFRGGDTLVIVGGTTLVIVLLVVLILVLL